VVRRCVVVLLRTMPASVSFTSLAPGFLSSASHNSRSSRALPFGRPRIRFSTLAVLLAESPLSGPSLTRHAALWPPCAPALLTLPRIAHSLLLAPVIWVPSRLFVYSFPYSPRGRNNMNASSPTHFPAPREQLR